MNTERYTQWLRIMGWLEGASFLALLCIAMPMKYMAGNPMAVKALGPVHGGLFLVYILLASIVADRKNWLPKIRVYSYLAAVLPFGTFIFEKKHLQS